MQPVQLGQEPTHTGVDAVLSWRLQDSGRTWSRSVGSPLAKWPSLPRPDELNPLIQEKWINLNFALDEGLGLVSLSIPVKFCF